MDLGEKSKLALSLKLSAPAKVNLRLKITGRRPDGYHLLDMVMAKLNLSDEIELDLAAGADSFDSDSVSVPRDETNSLLRAVDLVRRESGKEFGAGIFLKKRIPTAAGLGGGSSDAAAVLTGLNSLLGLGWNQERLLELGLRIGADVPFFLVSGAQRVRGIGEELESVAVPPLPLVLVNPGFPVSTAEAYRWWDEIHNTPQPPLTLRGGEEAPPLKVRGGRRGYEKLTTESPLASLPPLENDLEQVVIPRYPVLAEVKGLLTRAGALGTLMSGSGPTVFGVFKSLESRDRGYEILKRQEDPSWWVCQAESV